MHVELAISSAPKKEGNFLIHPDLKIGAINLDINKLRIFNSPELQLGERIPQHITELEPIINHTTTACLAGLEMTIKQHIHKYLMLNIPIFVVELINI